jgi:hypothetical protein
MSRFDDGEQLWWHDRCPNPHDDTCRPGDRPAPTPDQPLRHSYPDTPSVPGPDFLPVDRAVLRWSPAHNLPTWWATVVGTVDLLALRQRHSPVVAPAPLLEQLRWGSDRADHTWGEAPAGPGLPRPRARTLRPGVPVARPDGARRPPRPAGAGRLPRRPPLPALPRRRRGLPFRFAERPHRRGRRGAVAGRRPGATGHRLLPAPAVGGVPEGRSHASPVSPAPSPGPRADPAVNGRRRPPGRR